MVKEIFWTTADPIFKMGANGEIKSELSRTTNFENAFFNQFDFPNVNLYEISANLISKQEHNIRIIILSIKF